MAAKCRLSLNFLRPNAIRELLEPKQPAYQNARFAMFEFTGYGKGQWTDSVGLMLVLILLLSPASARATWIGSDLMPAQSSVGLTTPDQADDDVRELELGKPIERDLSRRAASLLSGELWPRASFCTRLWSHMASP